MKNIVIFAYDHSGIFYGILFCCGYMFLIRDVIGKTNMVLCIYKKVWEGSGGQNNCNPILVKEIFPIFKTCIICFMKSYSLIQNDYWLYINHWIYSLCTLSDVRTYFETHCIIFTYHLNTFYIGGWLTFCINFFFKIQIIARKSETTTLLLMKISE